MQTDRHVLLSADDDDGRGEQWFSQSALTKAFHLTFGFCFSLIHVSVDRIQPVVEEVCWI